MIPQEYYPLLAIGAIGLLALIIDWVFNLGGPG